MVTLGLAIRAVRHQPTVFAASFVTLALSAFLVTVCGGLLETGLTSDTPPQRLLTAPVVVTGVQDYRGVPLPERDRLASGLAGEIAAVPGVARTVADVSFPVMILLGGRADGPPANGHGWSSAQLTPYRLISGRAPADPGDVVLDARLASRLHLTVNSAVHAQADGTVSALRVVGIVDSATTQAPALFVTDARARALTGQPGQADSFAVYPTHGTQTGTLASRITAALPIGSAHVLTGAARGRAEFPNAAGQSANLIPLAGASGGLMTVVAMFIVASTLGLAVQLRRRQIALLRAVGAAPRQLRRLIFGQTLLVAVPAAGLGLLPTEEAGRRLLAAMGQHGLTTAGTVYHQSFIPTLSGAGIAVLTGVVAALVAARDAIRVPPVEALASGSTPQPSMSWPRLVFGLLALAGASALAIVTSLVFDGPVAASTAAPSAMLWALSLALLAPAAIRPVLSVLGRVAAVLAPRTGHLAMVSIQGRGARTAALVTPVMLATGLTTALLYMQTSQQAVTEHAYAQHLQASLVVSSPAGGLPLDLADQASRLPGVVAASPLVTSNGFINVPPGVEDSGTPDAIPLLGLDAAAASRVARYQVTNGSLARLSGNTIAIPASWARSGEEVGDTLMLRFGDNTVRHLRIVAVFAGQRGYPVLLLPAGLLAPHTTSGLAGQILVSTTPHTDPGVLEHNLSRLSADNLQVSSRSAALTAFSEQQQTGAWVYYMFIAALIAYVTVSLISATVAATARRRRQLQMLRRIGASGSQVRRAMTIEAALVAVAGIVLGTLVALATLLPFDSALGAPGLPAGPLSIYIAVTTFAAALTIAATRLSAQLSRTAPSRV